jgi:hypothetical protein
MAQLLQAGRTRRNTANERRYFVASEDGRYVMRRRQIQNRQYLEQSGSERMAALQAPPKPAAPVARGACPKCGMVVGRGVAMHIRRCKG